jgi:flagellin-like protein
MTLKQRWRAALDDQGVSPVIAVILMVAITVVLAATVYVWVSGFATEDTGPEQASATASGADLDDNGDVEWIQLTLTKGENAPYDAADVTNSTIDDSGSSIGFLCTDASAADCASSNEHFREDQTNYDGDSWDVGETLWVPCQGPGNHQVTISVGGTTILDQTTSCDQSA